MSALQQASPPESYVAKLAREKRERQARFAAKAWVPGPRTVEIREEPQRDTRIPVVASNGQVVIITGTEIKAAKALFEPVSKVDTIRSIKAEVCRRFHVSMNDLMSGRREFIVARARHTAMYLAKQLTTQSMPEIGRQFGGRDHTTILHAVRKIERLMITSEDMREHVDVLTKRLTGITE